jgi:hypothetical protein
MSDSPSLEKECFFIAPIGDDDSETRHRSDGVLAAIVEPAAAEVGLTAIRADGLAKPGQITAQIIEHVLGAKAAVADLTGKNANVLYELAIRHTANLPVVLIAEDGEVLPFDTAQMRTIFFSPTDLGSAATCKKRLVVQLREGLAGNFDSPVAAAVDLRALRSSGDAVQRSLADLLNVVGEMSAELKEARRDIRRSVVQRAEAAARADWMVDRVEAMADIQGSLNVAWEARPADLPELEEPLERARLMIERVAAMSPQRWDYSDPDIREVLSDVDTALTAAAKAAPPENMALARSLDRAMRVVAGLTLDARAPAGYGYMWDVAPENARLFLEPRRIPRRAPK